MAEVVKLDSAAVTPRDILEQVLPDADRMRAVAVVVLLDDGSWHVRHSTTQQSVIDSAAVQFLKFVQSQ